MSNCIVLRVQLGKITTLRETQTTILPKMSHQDQSSRRLKRLLCNLTTATKTNHNQDIFSPVFSLQHQTMYKTTPEQEDIPYPLVREEALNFLQNLLHISDPASLHKEDPTLFLNTFIHRMITEIPFTNIPQVSQPMDDKHCQPFAECKRALFSRQGGHCFFKNIFSKALLDLMGYKTFHVAGNNPGDNQIDSHTAIIVYDLSYPGSLHLAEPGTRRPLFEAIPLDFDQESPEYHFLFLRSKFFKRDDGILLWCAHAPAETAPSAYVIQSGDEFWKVQVIYRLNQKRTRKYFADRWKHRYSIPSLMPEVHQLAFICAYKDNKFYSYFCQNGLAGFKVEGEDSSQTELRLTSLDEMVESIVENFPQYNRDTIQTALDNVGYSTHLYRL